MEPPTTLLLLLLAVVAPLVAPQRLQLGPCPNYQTTLGFNARKISELVRSTDYVTALTVRSPAEAAHSCQRLKMDVGNKYSYIFNDQNGERIEVTGTYRAVPSSFKESGYLEISGMRNGVLGADVFGNVRLFPLVLSENADVYTSCTSYGLFHTENVYTFVPYSVARTRNMAHVRNELKRLGVPHSERLVSSDQSCDPAGQLHGTLGEDIEPFRADRPSSVAGSTNRTAPSNSNAVHPGVVPAAGASSVGAGSTQPEKNSEADVPVTGDSFNVLASEPLSDQALLSHYIALVQ